MYLKSLIETKDGEVEFTANLAEEELQFLLEYAINDLMQKGALPFASVSDDTIVNVQSLEPQ